MAGFPGGSDSKKSACSPGDLGSILGLGRSPGGEHGNPLQDSCLENPMDRGPWKATVHGVAESQRRQSTAQTLMEKNPLLLSLTYHYTLVILAIMT